MHVNYDSASRQHTTNIFRRVRARRAKFNEIFIEWLVEQSTDPGRLLWVLIKWDLDLCITHAVATVTTVATVATVAIRTHARTHATC